MSGSVSTVPRPPVRSSARLFKPLALAAVLAVAVAFVAKYVFHYYLHYNPPAFFDLWPVRGWLLIHISCGTIAILIGPFQFSRRLRRRNLPLHRITGRVYLIAVLLASLASLRLAWAAAANGWAWGFGLAMLAVAWLTTSGMAFYAVRKRQITIHKEWMVRSYVVTFAFVTFRLLNDYGPTSHLQPANDRAVTIVWAAWVLPLLATEVILQLRNMHRESAAQRQRVLEKTIG
jgi:uncharacterized membrane protein